MHGSGRWPQRPFLLGGADIPVRLGRAAFVGRTFLSAISVPLPAPHGEAVSPAVAIRSYPAKRWILPNSSSNRAKKHHALPNKNLRRQLTLKGLSCGCEF